MPKGDHLGDLEELMLLSVLRLGEDAHGGGVRDELGARAQRTVSISTVYVTLMRLEEKGYVRSWKGEPTGGRGGKAKRHYSVTPEGRAALEAVRTVRADMWAGIPDATDA
ncbi:MAG: PadR family transcriptional regulator [Gemmatimonadota bacterium]